MYAFVQKDSWVFIILRLMPLSKTVHGKPVEPCPDLTLLLSTGSGRTVNPFLIGIVPYASSLYKEKPMKNPIQKIAVNSALLLIATLPISLEVSAAEDKNPASLSALPGETSVEFHKQKLLAEKNQQIINEAKDAVLGTQQALQALEKNDNAAALGVLQEVSKKLALILANSPALVSVTAGIEIDIVDFAGNASAVEQKVKQAGELLRHGKLQAGRMVVDELASEIEITTVNIPLGSYPAAIKNAVEQINAGKAREAAQILETALNSLIEQTEIIPLPLLRAEVLILKAAELEKKSDLSKEKNRDEVLKLVAAAKEKLKIAEALGYGNKDDYQPFYKAMDDIKHTVHTEKSAAAWEKIKQSLTDLKNKITPAKK